MGRLALLTAVAAPPAGWLSDRFGRVPVMIAGAAAGALGALSLIAAHDVGRILLFGSLMSLGSAAFAAANWAAAADLAPLSHGGRMLGLAHVGTGGAAAAAGLFGPVVEAGNAAGRGVGYTVLLTAAALCCCLAVLPLRKLSIPAGEGHAAPSAAPATAVAAGPAPIEKEAL